ncbi:arrestin domain-containing protein 17-like [Episyrphus balteatus]|uniref:arrestin domain-containing protein 17-like n=1 Tax=Episyrphus balteatus TaxID=286459 RepID=UPI002486465B|nr:arrestin domain-containing protein 17-like [Episyrphus balteatus]
MPSSCAFMYDHPDAVYYSGDVLNGKIIYTTDKVKNVRGIYITIKGSAKVRWTETKSRHNSNTNKTEHYTVEYKGDRKYLHSETMIVGSMDLPIGTHEYTFSTPLPPQIPSSISDEYGHVSYEVELKLDRPMRIDDVYTNCFTVIHPINLNYDPSYLQAVIDTEQKNFCCFCCESGPLNSELRTQFGGYAPGQKLHFTVTLDNESDRDIEECSVELVRKTSFHSDSPEHKEKKSRTVISTLELPGVTRFCKKLHEGSFTIPPLPPSTVGSDDIIRVYYYLRAEVETGCFANNEILHAGVTIGTVPLIASATNPDSVITVQPTAPVDTTGEGGDLPPQYGSVVPPSFEEATGMNKPFVDAEADEHRVLDPFVPKYPVYHNFATPSAPGIDDQQPLTKEAEAMQSANATQASAPLATEEAPPYPSSTGLPYPSANVTAFPSLPYPAAGFNGMPIPGSASRVINSVENQEGSNIGWQPQP